MLYIVAFMVCFLVLFLMRNKRKKRGDSMAYGSQIYDGSGKEIFNSNQVPFKFIDEQIVFEGENKTFTYSLPGYKLVAWLAPMQPILEQRVFIKINNNSVVVKSNVKNINKEVKYRIFIGAY